MKTTTSAAIISAKTRSRMSKRASDQRRPWAASSGRCSWISLSSSMCTPPKGGGRRVLIHNIAQFSTGRAGIKSQLFAATPSIFEVNFRFRACQTRTLNVGVTPCVWQVDQVANPETSQQPRPYATGESWDRMRLLDGTYDRSKEKDHYARKKKVLRSGS